MIDLDSIHKMWEADAVINQNELDNASAGASMLHAKYLRLFNTARLLLKQREVELADIKTMKWLYLNGKMTQTQIEDLGWPYDPFNGSTKPLKNEMCYYIDSDKDVQKILLKIEYSKVVAETLEEILNVLRWRQTVIKNMIEWRKFNAGI